MCEAKLRKPERRRDREEHKPVATTKNMRCRRLGWRRMDKDKQSKYLKSNQSVCEGIFWPVSIWLPALDHWPSSRKLVSRACRMAKGYYTTCCFDCLRSRRSKLDSSASPLYVVSVKKAWRRPDIGLTAVSLEGDWKKRESTRMTMDTRRKIAA